MLIDTAEDEIEKRVEEIGSKIQKNDKYLRATEEYIKLFHQIKKVLPDEYKKLMFELDSKVTDIHNVSIEVTIEQCTIYDEAKVHY